MTIAPALIAYAGSFFAQMNLKLAIAAVALIAALTGGYIWGHSDAANACKARELAAQLAQTKLSLATVEGARRDAVAKEATLQASNVDLSKKVNDYADELSGLAARVSGTPPVPSAAPPSSCLLSADDLGRLRQIR